MRHEACEIMAFATMVDGTPHVERLNSVHASPIPRYLFGRISEMPASHQQTLTHRQSPPKKRRAKFLTGIRHRHHPNTRPEHHLPRNQLIHRLARTADNPSYNREPLPEQNHRPAPENIGYLPCDGEADSRGGTPAGGNPEVDGGAANLLRELHEDGGCEDEAEHDGAGEGGAEEEGGEEDGPGQRLGGGRVVF